jgi:hypothetical protein
MKRIIGSLLFSLTSCALVCGEAERGTFDLPAIKESIAKILSFSINGKTLQLETEPWKLDHAKISAKIMAEDVFANIGADDSGQFVALRELKGPNRKLIIRVDPILGLSVGFITSPFNVAFSQMPGGPATLSVRMRDASTISCAAADFESLLKAHADKLQIYFLRPLADMGVQIAPHKYLPPVMAAATVGYSRPPPDLAKQATDLIAKLSAEKPEDRDAAAADLTKLYPRAIFTILEAEKTAEGEVKARLQKVIAAHPGIAKARAFVEKEKLHEDRAYIIDIFATVPFFKDAAHARLITLYHNVDYGDDPKSWPLEQPLESPKETRP